MTVVLVRFGAVPEVARAAVPDSLSVSRGDVVILRTHRGEEIGTALEFVRPPVEPNQEFPEPEFEVIRLANEDDQQSKLESQRQIEQEFADWHQRISDWDLDLQLIEMERILDSGKLVLYVLNERGPECTKLALQAAAAGLGIIEVQPVGSDGPVALPAPSGGGCGSCGCH
ncbi:hypothetical protein AB1L42_06975 [Thalassoglobus sp. JC818]|uniref:hypothetical protein n=1 Tax=Thalassoglobus sp. JC818 TaxID=3232136 RepID=UPI0034591F2B